MYKVNYKGQYKSPEFNSFSEAYSYCEIQAPLIGYTYSYFEIYNDTDTWNITFKKTDGKCVETYRKHERKNYSSKGDIPIILHYGGSDQDQFASFDREKAINKIKEIAPKLVGNFVILIHGNDMWRTSYDGKTLHHQPVKLVNGEYINIIN